MTFANLLTSLAEHGLSVVRQPDDSLSCRGDQSRLTVDLRRELQQHRREFLQLLPSAAEQCKRIVSQTIDAANAECPPEWFGSAIAWETYDEFEQRLYDAARAADVAWTKTAADEFLQTCRALYVAPKLMAWAAEPTT